MDFRAFQNPGNNKSRNFDLIQYQRDARTLTTPQSVFQMWEDVCRKYEVGVIAPNEWEELKDTLWSHLAETSKLKRQIDSSFSTKTSAT
jgi:hypothetical protein